MSNNAFIPLLRKQWCARALCKHRRTCTPVAGDERHESLVAEDRGDTYCHGSVRPYPLLAHLSPDTVCLPPLSPTASLKSTRADNRP
eukprot:6824070-Lingulodinium_polyedra.AAC.1